MFRYTFNLNCQFLKVYPEMQEGESIEASRNIELANGRNNLGTNTLADLDYCLGSISHFVSYLLVLTLAGVLTEVLLNMLNWTSPVHFALDK